MAVYLLHIEPPFKHSRHYVGFTASDDVEIRLERHRAGTGGALPREAVRRGSKLLLAHVWKDGTREFERYVKKHGGAVRWCPLCKVNTRRMPSMESM